MTGFKPFFINSNICMEETDVSSFDVFTNAISSNSGNSYITYGLMRTLFGGVIPINHIQNIFKYDFTKQDKDLDCINNHSSHVFLILQDCIRSKNTDLNLPYENLVKFIKKINKPIIVAGVGQTALKGLKKISIKVCGLS